MFLILDPIVVKNGEFQLRLAGANVPIYLGEKPLTSFLPGWRATALFTAFAPMFLLELQHDDGHRATWYLDYRMRRVADDLRQLSPELQDLVRLTALPILRQLMDEILFRNTPYLSPVVSAFMTLNAGTRDSLAAFFCESLIPRPSTYLAEHLEPASLHSFNANGDLLVARRAHIADGLGHDWQDRIVMALRQGGMTWPSPIDGKPVRAQGAIAFDDFYFAYRFADTKNGLVFFVLVGEHNSSVGGVWFPTMGIVVSRDEYHRALGRLLIQNLPHWFVTHSIRWADRLIPYLNRGVGSLGNVLRGRPGVHIGHQLWNELSGIDELVRRHPHVAPTHYVLNAPSGIELYGAIDSLFPEITGKVDRTVTSVPALIEKAYSEGILLCRITAEHVSAELRQRILSHNNGGASGAIVQAALATIPRAPIIVIGLRVENRTLIDLVKFFIKLVDAIDSTHHDTTFVFDGHNVRGDGTGRATIESHGERLAAEDPSLVEKRIVAAVRTARPALSARIFDSLNCPMSQSIAWVAASTCFFSIWGASLAKYRWVGNKPGFVISSRYNLTHRADLHIYDSPNYMEDPTILEFLNPNCVLDRPEAVQLVPVAPGLPSFFNFDVDEEQTIAQFMTFLAHVIDRGAGRLLPD